MKVTNNSHRAVQLRAAAASGQNRDFESTIVDAASVVDEIPSLKKRRGGYGSTQVTPPISSSNGNTGHRLPSSAFENPRSRMSRPQPCNFHTERASAGNPALSRNVAPAPHTHPSVYTAKTSHTIGNSPPGHGTMEAPIEIDDEVSQKPKATPNYTHYAASLESKSTESANPDQESIDPGIGNWDDVKPWDNDTELDNYLAKELADFPDDVETPENLPDGQTNESAKVSTAAADPVPKPIFANFRDQVPQTKEDEISVNQAIQHTYNDLSNKVGWEVAAAAFAEKVEVATKESYGHQYNTLQARYVDKLVGQSYLASTKRKSKKQKKAERAVEFLYEVEGPWKTGFGDWKPTNAPSDPNKK